MNHSNAITDILNECLDLRVDEGQAYIHDTDEAQQALYEAVASKTSTIELSFEQQQKLTEILEGYRSNPSNSNKYRTNLFATIDAMMKEVVLTNLSLLFGVDLGASEKPKSGNKPSGKQVDTRTEQLIPQSEIDAELEATAKIEKKFRDGELR